MALPVRKLFVHVGPSKTGTSAVQHVLRTHDNSSVIYPKVGLWADGAHHNLVFNFYQDFTHPQVVRSDIHRLFAEIAAEASRYGGDLLISSELLAHHDVGALIRALLPWLGGGPWDPEILVVCREHFGTASSTYNQRVKDAVVLERREPDAFLQGYAAQLVYAPLITELRRSGVPITALNYHPIEDFVERFLRHVGFAGREPILNELRNVSLSIKGLVATLAANNVAQTLADRDRHFAALRRQIRPFFAPSRFIFGRAAAEAADLGFRDDRLFLFEEFGIRLPAVDLAAQQDMFCINDRELNEIAIATADLGPEGEAIVAFARRYLPASRATTGAKSSR
jgi:hypothetical protein